MSSRWCHRDWKPLPLGAFAALAVASCAFEESLPPGAVVLCRDDGECPTGLHCVLHECTPDVDIDKTGPVVLAADFAPAAARDGSLVTLTLHADEPLAVQAPTLGFAGTPAPAFDVVPEEQSRTSTDMRLTLVVDSNLAERIYDLREVTLADGGGNVRTSVVAGAVLHIDRTPPSVERIRLVGGVDGVVSDRAGSNDAGVRFFTSEFVPTDEEHVDVRLGSQRLSCRSGEGPGEKVCTTTVDGRGVVQGDNPVVLTVRDEAGNEGTALASMRIDVEPPAVVASSVELTIDGSRTAPYAQPGSQLELSLLFDEPLAEAPSVTLEDGQALAFDVLQANGSSYRLGLTLPAVAAAGTYGISARATDRFGHEGSVVVPLPAPYAAGVPLVEGAVSPCTVPEDENGNTCTDFDGDGAFGVSAGCAPPPDASDCDDADPLVFPGAGEIPDDGKRNDCLTGDDDDVPLDGMYLDPVNGDDANPGTREAPRKTLTRPLLEGETTLVLARGTLTVSTTSGPIIQGRVLGGFDPVTWERTAERSTIQQLANGNPATCAATMTVYQLIAVGVTFLHALRIEQRATLIDSEVRSCARSIANAPIFVVESAISSPLTLAAAGNRILDSELTELDVAGEAFVAQSRIDAGLTVTGEVTVVNSAIGGNGGRLIDCSSCAAVRVATSNLFADASSAAVRVTGDLPTLVAVVASNLRVGSAPVFDLGPAVRLAAADNLLFHSGATLVARGGLVIPHDDAGLATLNACTFDGCIAPGGGNFDGAVDVAGDRLHAVELGAASDARGKVRPTRMPFAPSTMARDVDGQCRYADGAPDVGPDEL